MNGVKSTMLLLTALAMAFTQANASGQSFTDDRDGKKYKAVKIGGQVWMAENLNYKTGTSWCYGNDEANCKKYGRLYNWNTAKAACPSGWHLPDTAEWNSLMVAVGGAKSKVDDEGGPYFYFYGISKKLKSKIGWDDNKGKSGNGTDEFGFSALPGGRRDSYDNSFYWVGGVVYLWSATNAEDWGEDVYRAQAMGSDDNDVSEHYHDKSNGFSVRCIQTAATADYSFALQTHFPKGTLGEAGKTRPIEMFFQNVFKSGNIYSISGKSKTNAAEDIFAGTLTISSTTAGSSCPGGETEIKGSYDLNEKESKTSGSFKGTFTACEKGGKLSKASFKGNWVKHSNGNKTPCDFGI